MRKIKHISLIILIVFYFVAGVNHFRDPGSYTRIIPDYLPFKPVLNYAAGFFELLFSVMLIFVSTRKLAAWGIMLMLLAFLPVHITMAGEAPLQLGKLTVTPLIAWLRLIVLQPLLILWALWSGGVLETWSPGAGKSGSQ
jgi:uncharacterized membrane protein